MEIEIKTLADLISECEYSEKQASKVTEEANQSKIEDSKKPLQSPSSIYRSMATTYFSQLDKLKEDDSTPREDNRIEIKHLAIYDAITFDGNERVKQWQEREWKKSENSIKMNAREDQR